MYIDDSLDNSGNFWARYLYSNCVCFIKNHVAPLWTW